MLPVFQRFQAAACCGPFRACRRGIHQSVLLAAVLAVGFSPLGRGQSVVFPAGAPAGTPVSESGNASHPAIAAGDTILELQRSESQQQDLQNLLASLQQAGNSSYHQWLTPEQFGARFGASSAQMERVKAWAVSQGLQVVDVSPSATRVYVRASAAVRSFSSGSVSQQVPAAIQGDVRALGTVGQTSSSGLDQIKDWTSLAAAVDANQQSALVLDCGGAAPGVGSVLEQAAAQGITVIAYGTATQCAPAHALILSAGASSASPTTQDKRPDWQVAPGLPADAVRAVPDAILADSAQALTSGLESLATQSGRIGEIAPRLYQLSPLESVVSHADPAIPAGTWQASDGLGTLHVAAFLKALNTGTAGTTSVISVSGNTVTHGSPLTVSVAVQSTGSPTGTPTGTVTFSSPQSGSLGSVALAGGVASLTTNTLPGGSYGISGAYSGDATFAQSTSGVNTVNIQPENAAVSVSVGTGPFSLGDVIPVTVTVTSPSGVGTPSGPVSVILYGTSQPYATANLAASTGTSATATVAVPAAAAGAFTWQAKCTTSASFACYNQVSFPVSIKTATPTVTLKQGASTSAGLPLSISVTPPTAAATGFTMPSPTGLVTVQDNGTALGTALLVNGAATYTASLPSTGTHSLTAVYAGDSNYASGTSTAVTPSPTQTVGTIPTITTMTGTPLKTNFGQAVTFTVQVAATSQAATGGPTGTVILSSSMQGVVATGTLINGTATIVTSALQAGTHGMVAMYLGDSNYASSNTSTSPVMVTVAPVNVPTSVTVTASPASPIVGSSVTLTATVQQNALGTAASTATPTGTVTFYDTVSGVRSLLATVALSGTGQGTGTASLSTTTLRSGGNSITAVYSGDTVYVTSTSAALLVPVGDFSATLTPGVVTLTQGGSTTVAVAVTTTGSFADPLQFGCKVPGGTQITCSFAPAVLTGSGTTVLALQTAGNSAAVAPGEAVTGRTGGVLSVALASGLLLLCVPRLRRNTGALLLLVLCAGVVSGGCGLGTVDATNNSSGTSSGTLSGGGGAGSTATPLGTQVLQITIASTNAVTPVVHTYPLQVTVQ